jgi:hypothetical protein
MASNEDHPHGDETVGGAEREIKRGITVMKKVIRDRDRGVLIKVHWNEGGQLIEPNGSTLTSFIGALVRNEVPITCDNWRNKQLNEAKDKIWSEIKVPYVMLFVFNDDYVFKLIVLTQCVYVFRRGVSTSKKTEEIIVSNWPESY